MQLHCPIGKKAGLGGVRGMGLLNRLLGMLSGGTGTRLSDQLLMDKVIGFKGLVPGVGTSTMVQNVAAALSESTSYAICVVDTNFIFPTQAPMLGMKDADVKQDVLDFVGDVAMVTEPTGIKGVRLASLVNRSITELLSTRDTKEVITMLLDKLKASFDIVLVDLSHEFTNINTYAAVKCNKIYLVADPSVKSMYHMQKSLNLMATLAIPAGKTDAVILNKVLPDINSAATRTLEGAGLRVVGEIPLSLDIATFGVSGKVAWGGRSTNRDLNTFSGVINTVSNEINTKTPLIAAKKENHQIQEEVEVADLGVEHEEDEINLYEDEEATQKGVNV